MKKKTSSDDHIHFGSDNWNLVLHMLFGIRQSVHSVQYDKVMKLDTVEFKQKTVFEIESMTDKKNSTSYQFCDFAPKVFQVI